MACNNSPTSPRKEITVVSPNGGEEVELGSVITIRWTSVMVKDIDLLADKLDGVGDFLIAVDVPATGGTFRWDTKNLSQRNFILKTGSYKLVIEDSSCSKIVTSTLNPPDNMCDPLSDESDGSWDIVNKVFNR